MKMNFKYKWLAHGFCFLLVLALLVFASSCKDNIFGSNKATIQGLVKDFRGRPVAGALISGFGKDTLGNPVLKVSGFTDMNGAYQMINVPLGVMNMSAELTGFQTAYTTVELTQKDDHPQVNFVLAGRGLVYGYVEDNNGKRIKSATVSAITYDTLNYHNYVVHSDTSGYFELTDIAVGVYNITANIVGLKTSAATAQINASSVQQGLTLLMEGAPEIKSFYQRNMQASKSASDSVRFAVATSDTYSADPNLIWLTVYAKVTDSNGYIVKIYELTSNTPSSSLLFDFALPASDFVTGPYTVEFEAEDNDYNRSTTYPASFTIVD